MMTADRQARDAQRYRGMESKLFELESMTLASEMLLDLYQKEKLSCRKRHAMTAEQLVEHLDQWSGIVDFSVRHVADLARSLVREYET